jgi:hypothetical protein
MLDGEMSGAQLTASQVPITFTNERLHPTNGNKRICFPSILDETLQHSETDTCTAAWQMCAGDDIARTALALVARVSEPKIYVGTPEQHIAAPK